VRIAVVNQHLHDIVGGSELQCHLVASGLAARGHDVVFAAVDGTAAVGPMPYACVAVPRDPEALARSVVALAPDVVYWRFNRRGLRETAGALARAGIPLVFAIAHVDDVRAWPSWPLPARGASVRDRASDLRSRLRWRRQLAAFDDVAAIASQRTDLIDRVPRDRVALQRHVPNIMDPTAEPFSWPRPYVAWVGNLKPRKRPELIPRIAAALAPHGVDLVVAGPVRDPRYRWLAEPVQGHPNLHHVGTPTPQGVTGLLAGARCLAVTAMPEGFSNVMIQAWWGATPTVTLDYDPDGMVEAEGLGAVAGGADAAGIDRFLDHVVHFALGESDAAVAAAGARAAVAARARFAAGPVLDALEGLLDQVSGPGGPGRDVGRAW
jgi:glycosyltransferase involved in cell wall biosynthesis